MLRASIVSVIGVTLALILSPAAVGAPAWAQAPQARVGARCPSVRVRAELGSSVAFAKGRWRLEAAGRPAAVALHRIQHDSTLIRALSAGDLGAAQAEADRQLVTHIVRIRVTRGARVLVDANPSSFAVAGKVGSIRGRHGASLGTAEVTIQDVLGFVKLSHRFSGAQLVVRGRPGQVVSTVAGGARAALPASGCVMVAGASYAVRSFGETGFAGEPVTVWVLRPA